MTSLIAKYGNLIFSFSFFILTLSVIIWALMSYGISVILYYIILIVSYYIFIVRLTKGKNLSPRQRRAYGQAFLLTFMFSSFGLTLMLSYSGLTYINSPALLVLILLIILFNFLSFLGILDAINHIRKSNPQQPNPPPVYPPYQQYPYPKRRFPIKTVIGVAITVVVVLGVFLVVLPIFFGSLPIFIRPSYPITVSDLQSIYGGSWEIKASSSYVISISNSSVTILYFNGTTKTFPGTPSNDTCYVFSLGEEPDSYLSKKVFVTFSYIIPVTANEYEICNAFEAVVYPVAGSPLYTELTTMSKGAFANTFGVSFVTVNGNIMYGYYPKRLLGFLGPWVVILNKANGELVVIVGLPYINSTIASELASYI
ncbi:hypothetical protein [Stygiolobus sp. RP850M]|uniref:hypothetical protein n=1 Tax=Stygiolobus sp. RP850M TaxID=3133137 RepID=UPI00307D2DF1